MEQGLQIFNHPQFGEIRAVEIDGKPWFVGKDVAKALGYTNHKKALGDHVDEEDKMQGDGVTIRDPIGRDQHPTIINEFGINDLVMGSKLKEAKMFKRWVTHEVLPNIRKNGFYMTEQLKDQIVNNPDILIAIGTKIKEEQERNRKLMEENKSLRANNEQMLPKALFADAVSVTKSEITVGELSKLVRQNGVDIGRTRMFQVLRAKGFLIHEKGKDWNLPTQRSMELGLFRVKESTIHANGEVILSRTPYVTGKGITYFMDKFLNGTLRA